MCTAWRDGVYAATPLLSSFEEDDKEQKLTRQQWPPRDTIISFASGQVKSKCNRLFMIWSCLKKYILIYPVRSCYFPNFKYTNWAILSPSKFRKKIDKSCSLNLFVPKSKQPDGLVWSLFGLGTKPLSNFLPQ